MNQTGIDVTTLANQNHPHSTALSVAVAVICVVALLINSVVLCRLHRAGLGEATVVLMQATCVSAIITSTIFGFYTAIVLAQPTSISVEYDKWPGFVGTHA